jgi:hypothetical protein
MGSITETNKRARRTRIAVLVLGIVLFASSCGKDGNIYGSLTWDPVITGTIGGFPAGSLAPNVDYQVTAGTWEVKYYIFDGTHYWPGGTTYIDYYWDAFYTVAADKGSIPFVNGAASYFSLYLSEGGMYKAGSVKSIENPDQDSNGAIQTPAPQTWTQNGLIITVTNKAVAMTPDGLSKLKNSQLQSK